MSRTRLLIAIALASQLSSGIPAKSIETNSNVLSPVIREHSDFNAYILGAGDKLLIEVLGID